MTAERPRFNYGIKVVFDIDRTISEGVFAMYLNRYRKKLRLKITDQQIEEYGRNHELRSSRVPEVMRYREQGAKEEKKYQKAYASIANSKRLHKHKLTPIKDSQRGVETWRGVFGDVDYNSVRPKQVESATRWWVRKHKFINHERLGLSLDPKDKLIQVLTKHVIERGYAEENVPARLRVVLVDDGYKDLIPAAEELANESAVMRRALACMALVTHAAPRDLNHQSGNLTVLNQQNWEDAHVHAAIGKVAQIAREKLIASKKAA